MDRCAKISSGRLAKPDVGASTHFLGAVGRDDLPNLYASCDAFVMPSTTETQGLVLAEALAAGVYVIASDAPAKPRRPWRCGTTGARHRPGLRKRFPRFDGGPRVRPRDGTPRSGEFFDRPSNRPRPAALREPDATGLHCLTSNICSAYTWARGPRDANDAKPRPRSRCDRRIRG